MWIFLSGKYLLSMPQINATSILVLDGTLIFGLLPIIGLFKINTDYKRCHVSIGLNFVSRASHTFLAYRIHISESTYQLLDALGGFVCMYRGTIPVKVFHI